MKRVEELLALPVSSEQWRLLLHPPICDRLETRFEEKVFSRTVNPYGEFQDESGFAVAKFFRAAIKGLDFWGGPEVINNTLVLIKHPVVDHARRGLGETNVMFEFGGYMFATGAEYNPLVALRPLYNQNLRSAYEKNVAALDVKRVPRFVGLLD